MEYTFYFESKYRAWGHNVKYLKFQLPDGTEFVLSDEWIVVIQGKKRTGIQRLIFLKRNNYANSYRVTVSVSSATNKASGEIVLIRETNTHRTSIIILLSDFQKLRYPVQRKVLLEDVEINERLIQDTLKYKVTVICIDKFRHKTEIVSKRDSIFIMSDQLNLLLNTGDFADIIITDDMGKCTIKAHRNILSARSIFFRCMFQDKWIESEEDRVVFRDKEDEEMRAIKEMIHYIYTGVVRPIKITDMLYLYMMSDQFLLDDLKRFLSEELRKNLNTENAVVIYILAGCVLDSDLKSSSLAVIKSNFQKIHNTQFWRAFKNNEGEYSEVLDYEETKNTLSEIINRRED